MDAIIDKLDKLPIGLGFILQFSIIILLSFALRWFWKNVLIRFAKMTATNLDRLLFEATGSATQIAFIAPGVGAVPQQLLEGDEIFIPPLTLDGSVAFPMRYARDGRFSIGETATKELKDQIIYQEEFVGWGTIKATISGVLGAQTLGTAGTYTEGQPNLFGELTLSGVNKMITKADGYQRKITDLYMSPTRYGNIRDWTTPQIDYFTQREIFKDAGPAAQALYGVGLNKVYDSTLLGDGEVYGFDTSSFGLMPIVQTLQTYEDPTAIKEWKIGILGREEVGFGVMDSWAIIRLRLDND